MKMDEQNQTKKQQPRTDQPKKVNPAEVKQEKRRKTAEQFQKMAQQNKKRLMPLVRFLKKNGLKIKTARCGKVRVQYFRTEQLQKILDDKKQLIEKDATLKDLKHRWQKQAIFFQRPDNMPKLKYPQQLQQSAGNAKSKFASFKFDLAEPKTWLFPAILIGIIAVVLFPLWPYIIKYSVFIVCLYLVIAIVTLILLRLVIYLFCAIFGVSVWIVPNFFADCGFLESFLPFYSVTPWESGMFSIVGRVLAFIIFGYYSYHLYMDPSWVFQNVQITKTSLDDLHDWGVSKIKGQKNFSQSALTNLDDIMNLTADVHVDEQIDLGLELDLQENEDNQNQQNDENEEQYENNQYEEKNQEETDHDSTEQYQNDQPEIINSNQQI